MQVGCTQLAICNFAPSVNPVVVSLDPEPYFEKDLEIAAGDCSLYTFLFVTSVDVNGYDPGALENEDSITVEIPLLTSREIWWDGSEFTEQPAP